jgi:hypothetical protein
VLDYGPRGARGGDRIFSRGMDCRHDFRDFEISLLAAA